MNEPRLQDYPLTAEYLVSLLTTGQFHEIQRGVPAGATVVALWVDHVTNTTYLRVPSEEFDVVPDGAPVPKSTIIVTRHPEPYRTMDAPALTSSPE